MDDTVDPYCPRCGQAPQTLEHWLDCPGTLHARLEMFTTTEALPLCSPHCQLFRASRSHWQDVVCDDLVRTPSATTTSTSATAAAAAAAVVLLVVRWAQAAVKHTPHRHISATTRPLSDANFLSYCHLCPRLGPSPAALRYVNMYFTCPYPWGSPYPRQT